MEVGADEAETDFPRGRAVLEWRVLRQALHHALAEQLRRLQQHRVAEVRRLEGGLPHQPGSGGEDAAARQALDAVVLAPVALLRHRLDGAEIALQLELRIGDAQLLSAVEMADGTGVLPRHLQGLGEVQLRRRRLRRGLRRLFQQEQRPGGVAASEALEASPQQFFQLVIVGRLQSNGLRSTMVCSRSGPVETMATSTPLTSSMRLR